MAKQVVINCKDSDVVLVLARKEAEVINNTLVVEFNKKFLIKGVPKRATRGWERVGQFLDRLSDELGDE